MALVSPSRLWAFPPSTCSAADSPPTSRKLAAVPSLPLKHAKGRRLSPLEVVRASPPDNAETTPDDGAKATTDRGKLALAEAKAYQKARKLSTATAEGNPAGENVPPLGVGGSTSEVPGKLTMERTRDYNEGKRGGAETGGVLPAVPDRVKLTTASERGREYKNGRSAVAGPIAVREGSGRVDPVVAEPVKHAMESAGGYEKNTGAVTESSGVYEGSSEVGGAVPDSVRLAMERAREYKNNKSAAGSDGNFAEKQSKNTGLENMKVGNPGSMVADNKVQKPGKLKVSSLDFLGLDFSEKKSRGVPAGFVPVVDPFSDGDLPEVEIIVGDASKFESSTGSKLNLDEVDETVGLYKPKVSTWGVFPRPSNISKMFGGGRNICPGEVLESADVKAAKEEHTRQLITSYKSKIGLTIDAKMKAECEKALKEGDHLMEVGKLREALPYYEHVMKNLAFQSELHGIAALQWSICQDSLSRPNEARVIYERLQSHPSAKVSKKARQFMFGFQAMEMMKVGSSSISKTTGYEHYFDAFIEDNGIHASKTVEQDESVLRQALPYMIFLLSPVFIVFLVAIRKSSEF